MNPEVAHEHMAGLNFLHAVAQAMEAGKLFHIDLNDQKPSAATTRTSASAREDLKCAFFLVKLLEDGGYDGDRATSTPTPTGPRTMDGVWEFARGCMRTYKILQARARQWNADPEIQALLAEANPDVPIPRIPRAGRSAQGARVPPRGAGGERTGLRASGSADGGDPSWCARMTTLDWLVIAAYFGLLLGITAWAVRTNRETADDYFLAGRNLGWLIVGASIFASNIGSEHLVGLAGAGATTGVTYAHYELHAWCLLVLGWVLVPIYLRSGVYTMPEFLERRFSPAARWVLSIISLIAYVLTKIAVGIFAGGVVFAALLPDIGFTIGGVTLDAFWVGSVSVVVLTGLYTVIGGMRAVAYTEAVQTLVLVVGSLILTVFGLRALGGWSELRAALGPDMFNLWKPLLPDGVVGTWAPVKEPGRMAWYFNQGNPWAGMVLCSPIVGLWYWCTDQSIVQRTLAAPSITEAGEGRSSPRI